MESEKLSKDPSVEQVATEEINDIDDEAKFIEMANYYKSLDDFQSFRNSLATCAIFAIVIRIIACVVCFLVALFLVGVIGEGLGWYEQTWERLAIWYILLIGYVAWKGGKFIAEIIVGAIVEHITNKFFNAHSDRFDEFDVELFKIVADDYLFK